MPSFENEAQVGAHMDNPLAEPDTMLSPIDATSQRHVVMAEYDESDGDLAQPIETEALFDVMVAHAQREMNGKKDAAQPGTTQAIFKDVKDWDAPVLKKDLKRMLEATLQTTVSNKLMEDLYRQIDANGDGTVTAREFDLWFRAQMAADGEGGEHVDAHQAQLKKMQTQTLIIDPNSQFRGNWDMVQAILLSESRLHIPISSHWAQVC